MSKEERNKIVPRLRFPEFRDSGEWIIAKFSEYIVLYRGSSPRPIQNYLTKDSSGINWIKIGDTKFANNFILSQVEERITQLGAKNSRFVNVGELILANSMSFGKTYQLGIEGCIYDGWFVLREYEHFLVKQFLLQVLNSDYMQRQYKKLSAGGIVQNISSDIVYQTIFPITSLPEQQKIADCLSSLDDLITAQSQKLESLKVHKKGLMQQLFPAEGETVPKLRFAEFRDSEEWEWKTLSEICKITSGGTPSRTEDDYWNGNIPWVSTTLIDFNIINQALEYITEAGLQNSSAKVFPENTILMAMYGQGKTRGKVAILGIKAATNQACSAILLQDGYNTNFVFQYLASKYDEIRELSNKGGQENLSAGLIATILISIPVNSTYEQQKIADCLFYLDEIITAQAEKIEALKVHKKGLMQGLFPKLKSR